MMTRVVVSCFLAAMAVTASGQVPVPVVERILTDGNSSTRVSLFSNQVVVVSTRRGDVQDFMRLLTLPADQYLVYLETFEKSAQELDSKPVTSRVNTARAEVVLTLHVGPDSPRKIRFSPMSATKLPLARIMAALDDLQLQVMESSPSAEAMRNWEPKKGERVELLNGTFATVVEVWPEGLVMLEHEKTYIREAVPPDQRDKVILRVLEPDL
jgi:hypothetical protein